MRVLVYTPQLRLIVPAWRSLQDAFRHWRQVVPGVQFDHLYAYGNPPDAEGGNEIVTRKYQEAQRVFLAGEWDVFVAIEDDMVIPPDTFQRLLTVLEGGADVAYGLYCWRMPPHKWSAYTAVEDQHATALTEDPDAARQAWGTVIDVAGLGMGCTAITRRVLEAIPFQRRGPACNDWYLAVDAQQQGFVQRCDMGLVCGHWVTDPKPHILYPDGTADELVRAEYL